MNASEHNPGRGRVAMVVPEAIEDAAAEWFARCQAGLTPADQACFQAWKASDPRHAAALAELEAAWEIVSYPGLTAQTDTARQDLAARRQRRFRRGRLITFAAAGLMAAAAWLFVLRPAQPIAPAATSDAPAVVIRPDRRALPDGSVVELNAGAEIAVAYSPSERALTLVRGEALFTVARDPARPFIVSVGNIKVRAVGTAFSIRRDARQVDVLVTHGRVALEHADEPGRPRGAARPGSPATRPEIPPFLAAGSRIVIPNTEAAPPVLRVTAAEIAAALAWRDRRIEFTRAPLAEAVELFNRQNVVQLSAADAAAAQLRISGIFWSDDPEGFVRLLEVGFGLQSVREDDRIVIRGE